MGQIIFPRKTIIGMSNFVRKSRKSLNVSARWNTRLSLSHLRRKLDERDEVKEGKKYFPSVVVKLEK